MRSSRTSKVLALSLGKGLTTVVAIVSGMILSRVLSKADLATYRQTMLAYDIVLPLLSLGLASGIYYFLPTEKGRARGVVVDGLVMMVGMGLLYAIFIALGGNHLLAKRFSNPAIVSTLAYLVPLPIIMLPAGLLASVMVVRDQVQKLTVYNVLTSLILTTSIIVACLIWKTPDAMILLRVGVTMAIGLAGIYLMFQAVPKDSWRPQWRSMKDMVAYSLPLVGATAMGAISLQLDKIIVSSMCTPEQFAVYSNGAIEIPLVAILTGSIAAVIQPDLRRMVAAGDFAGALALFRQASMKSAVFLMPAMVFLLVSAEPFILVLFSAKYAGSVLPFQLYLLILPVRIVNFGVFMMALGKTRLILYRTLAGLCANLVLSIILVHWIGYIGAIISTIICLYSVNCALNFTVISKSVGCHWWQVLPFDGVSQLLGVSVLAGLPIVMLNLLPLQWPPVLALGVNAMVFAGILAAATWIFHVAPLQVEARRVWSQVAERFHSEAPR
jgi:O-antigen/teichoic acid export membrane protein